MRRGVRDDQQERTAVLTTEAGPSEPASSSGQPPQERGGESGFPAGASLSLPGTERLAFAYLNLVMPADPVDREEVRHRYEAAMAEAGWPVRVDDGYVWHLDGRPVCVACDAVGFTVSNKAKALVAESMSLDYWWEERVATGHAALCPQSAYSMSDRTSS